MRDKASGVERFNHPIVGEFELRYETLYPGDSDSQALEVYTVEPGTPAHASLRLLTTIAASGDPEEPQHERADVQRACVLGASDPARDFRKQRAAARTMWRCNE